MSAEAGVRESSSNAKAVLLARALFLAEARRKHVAVVLIVPPRLF